KIAVSDDASFALYRRDGVLLARHPHVDPKIGQSFGATTNFARLLGSLDRDTVIQVSPIDGRERMIAPHSLAHYPLLINVADTMDSVLSTWWQQVRFFGSGVLLMELIIFAIVLLGLRHLRSHEALEAAEAARMQAETDLALAEERECSERALHAQASRFD